MTVRPFAILPTLFLMGTAFYCSAQTETLTGKSGAGGFGGPIMEWSELTAITGLGMGGGGALVIGDFFLGGFGIGAGHGRRTIDGLPYEISFGAGGVWLGYTPRTQKLVHPWLDLRVGWGGADVQPAHRNDDAASWNSSMTFMHPGIGVEVNVTHWFRLAATFGYRATFGARGLPAGLGPDNFSSMTGGLVFRFGRFPGN